ncbi:hypothetical protein OGAPHI_000148 [Ogataea philodendri]|uniref:Uncharacterized protein n=1 Tax=Ogataea philodendri TaxID=1378263 RepID=A0A9P8PHL7_9ASCO|nr:uncharacterized protein OGAPHI_000148 [Ogataea philodendri]KAH3671962.1 hypothetical protein OGAPHI_000148 [Ogataea philodendri]
MVSTPSSSTKSSRLSLTPIPCSPETVPSSSIASFDISFISSWATFFCSGSKITRTCRLPSPACPAAVASKSAASSLVIVRVISSGSLETGTQTSVGRMVAFGLTFLAHCNEFHSNVFRTVQIRSLSSSSLAIPILNPWFFLATLLIDATSSLRDSLLVAPTLSKSIWSGAQSSLEPAPISQTARICLSSMNSTALQLIPILNRSVTVLVAFPISLKLMVAITSFCGLK